MTQQSHYKAYTLRKDTCNPMFIAALFIIARTWKQLRCPSTDEWIKNLWYIYTTEYYSAIKRNTSESVLMRWMNLEPIIQSEVSQKEKNNYHILTHIYGIYKDGTEEPIFRAAVENTDTENSLMDTAGRGRRGWYRKNWGLGPGSGLLSVLLFLVSRALRGSLSHSSMGSNSHSDLQPAKKEHSPPRRQGQAITFADTLQYLRASLVAQMVKNLPEQLTLSL